MTDDEKKNLMHIVERHYLLATDIQERKWEQKELEDAAWEKAGTRPKVIRQLSKEQAFDAVKREAQRQYEESLDSCRSALGMLADLPLGEHAMERAKPVKKAVRKARIRGSSLELAN
jgi:hypothetical protein